MSGAHTPGPWSAETPMDDSIWIVEDGRQVYDWRVIATLYFPENRGEIPRKQVEANALLIAAAPDLLEALQKARNTLAGCGMPSIAADICDAAIAKATQP